MKAINAIRNIQREDNWNFLTECWRCSHVDYYDIGDIIPTARQKNDDLLSYYVPTVINEFEQAKQNIKEKGSKNFYELDSNLFNKIVHVRVKCKNCAYKTRTPVILTSDFFWMYKVTSSMAAIKTFCRARKEQIETFNLEYKKYYDNYLSWFKTIMKGIELKHSWSQREKQQNLKWDLDREITKRWKHLVSTAQNKLREERTRYILHQYDLDTANHE